MWFGALIYAIVFNRRERKRQYLADSLRQRAENGSFGKNRLFSIWYKVLNWALRLCCVNKQATIAKYLIIVQPNKIATWLSTLDLVDFIDYFSNSPALWSCKNAVDCHHLRRLFRPRGPFDAFHLKSTARSSNHHNCHSAGAYNTGCELMQ